nr:uncharacterized protein LOC129425947 isoform X2 [Misgurnus anguillicaudatus]
MEKEGLKRSLEFLEARGVKIDCIVTDRHTQIQKFLRDRKVTQFYDVWHLEKGLSKKLEVIAKDKDCQVVKKWQRSIRNHVYWTAASSKTAEERVAKWLSMVNHIQDVHVHDTPAFPRCEHATHVSKDPTKWFQPATKALYTVEKLLTNKRMLKDVEKLSPHFQTSSLEAFHSVILRFAPKNVVYPYIGMLCRLYLACMHFNENSNRPQAKTKTGKPVYRLLFPKAKKGEYSTRPLKTQATYCYVYRLMDLILFPTWRRFTKSRSQKHSHPSMRDPPWKKPSRDINRGSVKGRPKSNVTACRVRKLLPYTLDDARWDNNSVTPAQIAPAPAHKTSVCQVPVTPTVKDINKVRGIALF